MMPYSVLDVNFLRRLLAEILTPTPGVSIKNATRLRAFAPSLEEDQLFPISKDNCFLETRLEAAEQVRIWFEGELVTAPKGQQQKRQPS